MPKPTTGPGRSGGSRSTATRPLGSRPQRVPAEVKAPWRRKLEVRSVKPLLILRRQPRLLVVAVILGCFVAGLFAPPVVGGAFLLVLTLFIGWLLTLSWPALVPSARLIRILVTGVLLFAALYRFSGRG